MRRAALLILLALLTCACRKDPDAALYERSYLPGTEYLTSVHMTTVQTLHQETADGKLAPGLRESRQELFTTQRLRFGAEQGGSCGVELEMLDYRSIEPEQALQMDLAGCVGLASYDLAQRRLTWQGLKDSLWQAKGTPRDSNFTLRPLSLEEAGSYLASTVDLLNNALVDSTRRLTAGQGWSEKRRQETMIGPFPVAWTETRSVTLREMGGGMAFLEVNVELDPEALPDGPPIKLEGSGKGRIDFDLTRRFTAFSRMKTTMTIEVADSALTWIARSDTDMEIRTTAKP